MSNTAKTALLSLCVGVAAAAGAWSYAQYRARQSMQEQPVAPAIALPAAHKPPPASRTTFDLQPSELVDRYNSAAGKIDRALMLPPVAALADGGSNDQFYALTHAVKPNVHVSMEIDNQKRKPFSLSFAGASTGQTADSVALLSVMAAIGATVFGTGEDAGVVMRNCTKAADAPNKQSRERLQGLDVYCGASGGLWMGGVSVPKDAR